MGMGMSDKMKIKKVPIIKVKPMYKTGLEKTKSSSGKTKYIVHERDDAGDMFETVRANSPKEALIIVISKRKFSDVKSIFNFGGSFTVYNDSMTHMHFNMWQGQKIIEEHFGRSID